MYIRTWNPVTKEISKDTDQPWYKFDYCNYAEEPIKAYFGYQTHIEDSWVSPLQLLWMVELLLEMHLERV